MVLGLYPPAHIASALTARLRQHRIAQNFTQAELSARVGVSKATVVNLEAGKNVSFETVVAVVQVLGLAVELDDLFLYAPKTIADLEKAAALPTRVRKPKAFYGPKN